MYLSRFFPCPMRGDHWRKPASVKDSKPEKNYDALCLKFHRSKQIFVFIICSTRQPKSLKTTGACRESTG